VAHLQKKMRKKILIFAYHDMTRDPRPQRQIKWLKDEYDVEYIAQIPDQKLGVKFIKYTKSPSRLTKLRLFLLKFKMYNKYIWDWSNRDLVSQMSEKKYDMVIAHHIKLLPVAFRFSGNAKVILDAHEYYTEIYNDSGIWNFFMKNFYKWISDNYLHRCDLTIAVNDSMRQLYEKNFHIPTAFITNAADFVELQPSEVDHNNIKIIHHGLASKSRKIELMIEMEKYLDDRFSLTFILLEINYASREYVKSLKKMAGDYKKIIFLDVLPQNQLIGFCNDYDIGLFFMPPSNINEEYSLANKFFQYVQSRLVLAVSPLPEMKRLVEAYELGVVGDNYDPKAMAEKLNRLTAEDISHYKKKVHESAKELSSESNREKFLKIVADLLR
jgi:glycosyltransferase involved in cell wall biosynthesis